MATLWQAIEGMRDRKEWWNYPIDQGDHYEWDEETAEVCRILSTGTRQHPRELHQGNDWFRVEKPIGEGTYEWAMGHAKLGKWVRRVYWYATCRCSHTGPQCSLLVFEDNKGRRDDGRLITEADKQATDWELWEKPAPTVVGLKLLTPEGKSLFASERTQYTRDWQRIEGNGTYLTVSSSREGIEDPWAWYTIIGGWHSRYVLRFIEARESLIHPSPCGVECYREARIIDPCPERLDPDLLAYIKSSDYLKEYLGDWWYVATGEPKFSTFYCSKCVSHSTIDVIREPLQCLNCGCTTGDIDHDYDWVANRWPAKGDAENEPGYEDGAVYGDEYVLKFFVPKFVLRNNGDQHHGFFLYEAPKFRAFVGYVYADGEVLPVSVSPEGFPPTYVRFRKPRE